MRSEDVAEDPEFNGVAYFLRETFNSGGGPSGAVQRVGMRPGPLFYCNEKTALGQRTVNSEGIMIGTKVSTHIIPTVWY